MCFLSTPSPECYYVIFTFIICIFCDDIYIYIIFDPIFAWIVNNIGEEKKKKKVGVSPVPLS